MTFETDLVQVRSLSSSRYIAGEQWNVGIMVSGLMVKSVFKIKLKMDNILFKTTIPLFHIRGKL